MDDVMPIAPLMSAEQVSPGINAFEHFRALRRETSRLCYTEPTLIVVRHGQGNVFTRENRQNRTHRFQPESIGLFPAGYEHLCSPSVGNDFFCLTISDTLLRQTAEQASLKVARHDWTPILGTRDDILSRLTDTLKALIEERPESRLLLETLTQCILLRLAEAADSRRDSGPASGQHNLRPTRQSTRRIKRVIDALQCDPARDVGLDELAKLASLSPAYFSRTFKSFIGMSPSEFQTRERIKLAERMMLSHECNLTEIATAVGFHSVQGLRRAYQRVKGRPMRRWQAR